MAASGKKYRTGITTGQIVDAAVELTGQRGLYGWSIRELVATIGTSPSVVYHRVGGRDALCRRVVARVLSHIEYEFPDELVDHTVDLFAERAERGQAVLLITHDLRAARRVATDVAVMYASRLVECGPAAAVFDDPWHPYTRCLLDALPDRGFTPVPGHPPELTALPPGCGFALRRPDLHTCIPDPTLTWRGGRAVACAPIPVGAR
jgi:oligopeptide/dipeptide ABC transporter ATP-binding protein